MRNRNFFFGVLFGAALFVYLVTSFLISTFDITLWQDGHRFLAVVAYLFLVLSFFGKTSPTEVDEAKKAKEAPSRNSDTKEEGEPKTEQSNLRQLRKLILE